MSCQLEAQWLHCKHLGAVPAALCMSQGERACARTLAELQPYLGSAPELHALAPQGFIEGRYVPLEAGENVTASMDVVEAGSAEEAAAMAAGAKA